MIKILLFIVFSFVFSADGIFLTIDDNEYGLYSFYSRYPKKQWERADSLQKDKMLSDFVKREVCILEAEKLGFQNDPDVAVKIRERSLQILVNESYEQFVATPLIPLSELNAARKNAKRELFASHILIGYSDAYLGSPPKRTLDEALLLSQQIKSEFDGGGVFGELAEKYSDDPSAKTNGGSLGWVQWGATVPEFQQAAFELELGVLSAPVLTKFGYHLILVTDVRPSELQHMSDDAYENYVVNISKNQIREQLRDAALSYDSNKISEYGVLFNNRGVELILKAYERQQKDVLISDAVGKNSDEILNSLNGVGVLCIYGGKGYGSKWFSERFSRYPPSRQPRLDSVDKIISALKTIILQDIAVNEGFSGGVANSFSYKYKKGDMVSGLLYDAYLKYLVNSVPKPDSVDVVDFYEKNKYDKYMGDERLVVREIRVGEKEVADSLLLQINSGADFELLAQQNSLVNSEGGGLFGPFNRGVNKSLFDAAKLLENGGVSEVIPSLQNSFSIIQLVRRVPPVPIDVEKVYVRIESLLIKEGQDKAKEIGVDGLLDNYNVVKNYEFLQ